MENEIEEEFLSLEKICQALLDETRLFQLNHFLELREIPLPRKALWERMKGFINPITRGKFIGEGDYLIQVNNCEILSRYVLSQIEAIEFDKVSRGLFEIIRRVVDDCYLYVKRVTRLCNCAEERKKGIRAITLALKLGGKIPVSFFLDGKNEPFVKFIQKNYLHHILFELRLFLPFDRVKGPLIPIAVEDGTNFIPWKELQEVNVNGEIQVYHQGRHIFSLDHNYQFTEHYSCLFNGITCYNIYKGSGLLPFDLQDPKQWGDKHVLEIWTVSERKQKPSMFYCTHAFMILKDDQGYLYSVGQDSVLHLPGRIQIWQVLSTKPAFGLLPAPDLYVVYPKNARRFWNCSFEITKGEMEKILAVIERDRKDRERTLSFGKKNCVTYVQKILDEVLGIQIDTNMYVTHILVKSALPTSWYRFFYNFLSPSYNKLPPLIKKSLFFFPLYYAFHLLIAIIVRMVSQKNIPGQEDYRFIESLLKPWSLSAHHPLALHRKLEKHCKGFKK